VAYPLLRSLPRSNGPSIFPRFLPGYRSGIPPSSPPFFYGAEDLLVPLKDNKVPSSCSFPDRFLEILSCRGGLRSQHLCSAIIKDNRSSSFQESSGSQPTFLCSYLTDEAFPRPCLPFFLPPAHPSFPMTPVKPIPAYSKEG